MRKHDFDSVLMTKITREVKHVMSGGLKGLDAIASIDVPFAHVVGNELAISFSHLCQGVNIVVAPVQ